VTPHEGPPDVDRLAQSMLMLHGDHDSHERPASTTREGRGGSRSKAPAFAADPDRVAALQAATQADRTRYLTSGLQPVDCRFCHATVNVKRQGPGHTAVQWNAEASRRCASFAEMRASGQDSARARSCPKLADSIEHAVAEGCLEAISTAPPGSDG
jgi:hypothetical protein